MENNGYSSRNIERAKIIHDPEGFGVEFIYGIIVDSTEGAFSTDYEAQEDDQVRVGDRSIPIGELETMLSTLSKKTGISYVVSYVASEGGFNKKTGDFDKRAHIVGVQVPGIKYAHEQDYSGFVDGNTLRDVVSKSPKMIEDLTSLGFRDIDVGDLFLYANAYRH